jgi:hypothetical protein
MSEIIDTYYQRGILLKGTQVLTYNLRAPHYCSNTEEAHAFFTLVKVLAHFRVVDPSSITPDAGNAV